MHAQITAIGRLIADPELRTTPSAKIVAKLAVAVDHQFKKEGQQYPDSDVYYAEVWGNRGEAAVNMLRKGDRVFFTGRLETSKGQEGRTFLNVRNAEWSFTQAKSQRTEEPPTGAAMEIAPDLETLPF